MISYWVYILIGKNNTGKTTFQKKIISHLCCKNYKSLPRNKTLNINHLYAPRKLLTLYTINRSFQESRKQYKTVNNYFKKFFREADICILSSHSDDGSLKEIKEMIQEAKKRFYNVGVVFFHNGINKNVRDISLYDWDERFYIYNPITKNSEKMNNQINNKAKEFSDLLIRRAMQQ